MNEIAWEEGDRKTQEECEGNEQQKIIETIFFFVLLLAPLRPNLLKSF